MVKLNKFRIAYKGYRKFIIDSQDEKTAEEWAKKQMAVWNKTNLQYTVTSYQPEPSIPEQTA